MTNRLFRGMDARVNDRGIGGAGTIVLTPFCASAAGEVPGLKLLGQPAESILANRLKGPRGLGRTTHATRLFPSDVSQIGMRRIRLLVLTCLAALALAVPAVAEAANPPSRDEAVTVKRYLMGRVKPFVGARGAAHLWTNTGFSNRRAVYPVIRHQVLDDGSEWLQVKTLRGRSQVKVWIPKWATRRVWIAYRIKVDLSSRLATIYKDGKVNRRFRVVVGAPSTPTPTGTWFVVDRMRLRTSWAYGKWALATSAFSRVLKKFEGGQGQVALHARGTLTAPVGTAASHGCVRFRDGDIAWLAAHVPNGTSIQIQR
jgi:lipoprotein-anchoring transpeptidase ErfK/SrfK